ncbi:ABC transporter ATP-binding protein [Variovorax paradoxus]|uniref:ABC transporter ATP-binding protein n=1 Tax=Variovorax paradoxus TaxID=34073 RepID=UPI00278647DD|nr:ABC transporter ATP-binding protein [Variovorax paradoxus]MDP9932792.1 branched-chain amino acid transport system ATP-binding protein [Variovorax paradoxus]
MSPQTITPLLSVKGLVKRYGGLLVTDHVNLTIAKGEVHAVIGPNGAGKTTLINQVAGDVSSDAGRIELMGQDVTDWPVHARANLGLGRSYQITSVVPEFSVLENMLLALQAGEGHNFRFWQPVTRNRKLIEAASEGLEQIGLIGCSGQRAGTLSYGQQRQLELAMTLATGPQVLLLDEPMAGLGRTETSDMVRLLGKVAPQYGVLLVEHDMDAVFALATTCSVLVYGKTIFQGDPQEVRRSPEVREAYLGDEEIL